MAKIDPKFTEAMVAWLRDDHTDDESIRKGAMLLLQVNRNQGLYNRICRNPQRGLSKLEYEIRKHVNIRLAGYNLQDVEKLDAEITPEIGSYIKACDAMSEEIGAEVIPVGAGDGQPVVSSGGKRPDHDKLPVEIQNLWVKNAERWNKIKETYNLLLTLNAPCDRFEHLQLMKEAWYKYREDFCKYDSFKADDVDVKGEGDKSQLSENDRKNVDYAQSYISRYLPQLSELVVAAAEPDFGEAEKLEDLRTKIQNRVNTLLRFGVAISDQRKAELEKCDIKVELEEETPEESPEVSDGDNDVTDAEGAGPE